MQLKKLDFILQNPLDSNWFKTTLHAFENVTIIGTSNIDANIGTFCSL